MPRHKPAHGVRIVPTHPTIVFLTVCTQDRDPWLACDENPRLLHSIWEHAQAWVVGRYVLMPDHLHLFASPGPLELPLDNWVRYWKSQFSKSCHESSRRWQVDHWDTRLRPGDSYEEKWLYVKNNPVRAGLVHNPNDWPFQGELNQLSW
jgi:putative transposase